MYDPVAHELLAGKSRAAGPATSVIAALFPFQARTLYELYFVPDARVFAKAAPHYL